MTHAIEIRGLAKRFGDVVALDDVDLTVAEGSVYGFLGPNGAGKTTTLRVLTGLARADSGEALVFGQAPGSREARRIVGFLPDVPGFYGWMTAEQFLRFAGGLFGLSRDVLDERIPLLLDLAGLSDVRARIGGYSRGMKQRLGVAQALVNAPRLLLLDEPTSALDPLGRKDVLDMISSLRGRTTVFFSTHILADVERVCDTVAILDRGRVAVESPISDLVRKHAVHKLLVEVSEGSERLASELRQKEWVASVASSGEGEALEVTLTDTEAARREVPRIVGELGLPLVRFETGEMSLEDVFVELVGGERV